MKIFIDCEGIHIPYQSSTAQSMFRGAVSALSGKTPRSSRYPICYVKLEIISKRLNGVEVEEYYTEQKRSNNPRFSVGMDLNEIENESKELLFRVFTFEDSGTNTKDHLEYGFFKTTNKELFKDININNGNYCFTLNFSLSSSFNELSKINIAFYQTTPFHHPILENILSNNIQRGYRFSKINSSDISKSNSYKNDVKGSHTRNTNTNTPVTPTEKKDINNNVKNTLVNALPMSPIIGSSMENIGYNKMDGENMDESILAIELAAEVDYSVKIPLQLLQLSYVKLQSKYEEWREIYNEKRKREKYFDSDIEALENGHDSYRVSAIQARNLVVSTKKNVQNDLPEKQIKISNNLDNGHNSAKSSSVLNRIKDKAGMIVDAVTTSNHNTISSSFSNSPSQNSTRLNRNISSPLNSFVVITLITNDIEEHIIGKTNTEYSNNNPIWGINNNIKNCPHAKPNTKHCISCGGGGSVHSKLETVVTSENSDIKQFVFYPKSKHGEKLDDYIKIELFMETYSYLGGIENSLLGETKISLKHIKSKMGIQNIIGSDNAVMKVETFDMTEWFPIYAISNCDTMYEPEICGEIQLCVQIHLAQPVTVAKISAGSFQKKDTVSLSSANLDTILNDKNLYESLPLSYLYTHATQLKDDLLLLRRHIQIIKCLSSEKKIFKSSQDKKNEDSQMIPTNLHISYLNVYKTENTNLNSKYDNGLYTNTTQDNDLINFDNDDTSQIIHYPTIHGNSNKVFFSETINDIFPGKTKRVTLEAVYSTVTGGAPTAHVMGLNDYGLTEMEADINRLQKDITEQIYTNKIENTSSNKKKNEVKTEDALENKFVLLNAVSIINENTIETKSADRKNETAISSSHLDVSDLKETLSTDVTSKSKQQKKGWSNKVIEVTTKTLNGVGRSSGNKIETVGIENNNLSNNSSGSDRSMITSPIQLFQQLETLKSTYFLRKTVCLCQSVSFLVTCFLNKFELLFLPPIFPSNTRKILLQWEKLGFLIGWESLISSQGKELTMLSDAAIAIRSLDRFSFQLCCYDINQEHTKVIIKESEKPVKIDSSDIALMDWKTDNIQLIRQNNSYIFRVYVDKNIFNYFPDTIKLGSLISVVPVLFTQGINEMQSFANIVGLQGVNVQFTINKASLRIIQSYYQSYCQLYAKDHNGLKKKDPIKNIIKALEDSIDEESVNSKETAILLRAADCVRRFGGARVTYCKSGKDRTAMSLTLEHSLLLSQRHLAYSGPTPIYNSIDSILEIANYMREHGVRIMIAKKNVGRYKYSFNAIQRKLLPEIYRPPTSTIQDIITSVTLRDS